jgi:F-type H+-transporting ATPase subunit b
VRRKAIWFALFLALAVASPAQEHEAAKGEAHKEAAEPDMTGWKWANFAILAVGLGYLIVKNVGPYFASRSLEIRKGIEDAQKIRADAEAKAAQIETRLANLGREVEAMRQSAREEAAQEGARIRQDTERELAKVQAHADQEIASALKAAQLELKSYSARLAVDLARQKVRDRMTPADQDALVQRFVVDLSGKLEPGATS